MTDSPSTKNEKNNNFIIPLNFKIFKILLSEDRPKSINNINGENDSQKTQKKFNQQAKSTSEKNKERDDSNSIHSTSANPNSALTPFLRNIYNHVEFSVLVTSTKLKNVDEPPSHCLFKTHNYTISIPLEINSTAQAQNLELQRFVATATLRSSSNYAHPLGYSFQHNFSKFCLELVVSFQSASFARNTEFLLLVDIYVDENDGSEKLTKIISMESDPFYVYSKPDVYVKQMQGSNVNRKKKKNKEPSIGESLSSNVPPSLSLSSSHSHSHSLETHSKDININTSSQSRKRTRAPSHESSSFDESFSEESIPVLDNTPPRKRKKPSQPIVISSLDSDLLKSPPNSQNYQMLTYTEASPNSPPAEFPPSPNNKHSRNNYSQESMDISFPIQISKNRYSQENSVMDVNYFMETNRKPLKKRYL